MCGDGILWTGERTPHLPLLLLHFVLDGEDYLPRLRIIVELQERRNVEVELPCATRVLYQHPVEDQIQPSLPKQSQATYPTVLSPTTSSSQSVCMS